MSSILVAIPSLLVGGTEIQTLRLVEALNQGGHHVVTVCYFEYDFNMVQLFRRAGSKVECLSAYGNRPQGAKAQYQFLKDGLKRVVAAYRPKVAHVQYMAPGAIPIFILSRMGVKNIIATLHTDADIYKNLRLIHYLQKHKVTAFTCVTQAAEKNFFGSANLWNEQSHLAKRNHLTLYNCLAPKETPQPEVSSVEHAPLTIGFVGRLEPIKGADLVLPAFAELLKLNASNRDLHLRIVGDGSLRTSMEQQQKELGLSSDRLTWVGRVEHDRLAEQYQQMDIVWMPSRSEGFGLSAIEAMAYGCPVIASATGGLTEIVDQHQDALTFAVGDTTTLAQKSLQLINTPSLYQEVKRYAYTRSQDFTFAQYQSHILSFYQQVLERK